MGNADLPTRGGARELSTVEKAAMLAWELQRACAQGRGDAQSSRKSCKRASAASPRREPRRHQARATRGIGPAKHC